MDHVRYIDGVSGRSKILYRLKQSVVQELTACQTRQRRGRLSEEYAASLLERMGVHIQRRNYRTRQGEIDLIGVDKDVLVFVEVRSRRVSRHGRALMTVGYRKQRQLTKMAWRYILYQKPPQSKCRFDVLGFDIGDNNVEVTWVCSAFEVKGLV